ncbi:hypothetical protein [Lignipirellula cremea]|uniref:Uncharacterized protein n=1 Tax=Lignipirellula cremea TaxID=2528010 RepID=A0A518DWB0_9BACT|nr:hypothetical protein [Lignipirellula cremea]QDU96126.1 hypothetical protein Pla8534_39450 [Lignipirellula cremea]
MSIPLSSAEVLQREFFEMRAKLLELAASFDRLDRADGEVKGDPRMAQIEEALRVLLDQKPDRAEQIQLLFSLPYDDAWQKEFAMPTAR